MKKIITLILLVFSNFVFSQHYEKEWQKVYDYENDGKISSAQKEVLKIKRKAERKNNEKEIIKAVLFLSKFEITRNELAQKKIIEDLNYEIKNSSPISKSILHYILASILEDYKKVNYSKISLRSNSNNINRNDFSTWNLDDFEKEIQNNYEKIYAQKIALSKTTISEWKNIFDIPSYIDGNNYNLYDFFYDKHLEYSKTKILPWQIKNLDYFDEIEKLLLSEPKIFINSNIDFIKECNLKKVIENIQDYEKFYLIKDSKKVDFSNYQRIKYLITIHNNTVFPTELINIENTTKNETVKQLIKLDRAENLIQLASQKKDVQYQKKALIILDTILKSRVHPNILANAEAKKLLLTTKFLSFEFKENSYVNQNNRIFLKFKNIDSVKINYYKLPTKNSLNFNDYYYYNSLKNDSIVLDYSKKHKTYKSSIYVLPNQYDYFEHTTEILLDKLEAGNYLIFIETSNNSSLSKEKAFTYGKINVTDFYIVQDEDLEYNNIYVLNKKTGEPIEKVTLKSEEQTIVTNKNGKASFKKLNKIQEKKYNNEVLAFKDNDSIYFNYNRTFYDDYDIEDIIFEAKTQIFTDRAIYRPGQKIYFKGIVVQNKNYKKSVVPNLTVKVLIEDSKGEDLKEFEIQTNEFGSFFSEFEIPKNCLTGEFTIYVEEPDNYETDLIYYDKGEDEHSFWDNVDFQEWESQVHFQVEEYKRPTFEIHFDEIKENYTIGDTLKITGNARALAGNAITKAKVKYNISRSTIVNNKYIPYENNYIVDEIETDEKGNFSITYPATHNTISNDSIVSFSYTINAEITDSNGETRNASQNVTVSKYLLNLNLNIGDILYKENKLLAKVNTTTKNNYPIPTKVEVNLFLSDKKYFKKDRMFQIPEIQTISRERFNQLFPYEPYDSDDFEETPILVKSIFLNTSQSNNLDLSFLKKLKNGNYKIVAKAIDSKGNKIKTEKKFTLDSNTNPNLKEELFSYRDISNPNSDFIEIEFLSEINDLWITTRFFDTQSPNLNTRIDQLINGKKIIQLKKPKNKKYELNYELQFSSIWENKTYEEEISLKSLEKNKSLLIEIESLRNKIEPGSYENWSFKLKNSKEEAEFLASMYDSSLDFFTQKNWKNLYFNENANINFPNFYNTLEYSKYGKCNNFENHSLIFKYQDITSLELNWFGFNFNNIKYNYKKKSTDPLYIPKGYKIVSGVVSDDLGPIVGANIVVKGTTRGTTTDFNGNYEIAVKEGEILVVSFIGMTSQEVKIGTANNYSGKLTTASVELEGTVITALGIKRKADEITTSYTVIKSNELTQSASVAQALTGKVSGLSISEDKNYYFLSSKVILRGTSSVSKNKETLIVIDGEFSTAEILQKIKPDEIHEIQFLKGENAAVLYGEKGSNGVIIVTTKKSLQEITQVKTRTNFNETAFFYPNLKTDKNGRVSFHFTTPESLTNWKLRLFAHNKKYENDYFESSIISQKEVMIQTNMPRFFRENDSITISAKVVNMTNETKSGIAKLTLINAENNQIIDSITLNKNNIRSFICKPKESIPVNWTITLPENLSGLQYKIVASSGDFSDGEENIIPVLSNKIYLTESRPIWVKGNSKKEITIENLLNNDSNTLVNQKYTLEYSSNPLWIILQSLPYLLEYEHECAEQTFARYYANFIAGKVIEDNPKIKSILENWKNNNSESKFNLNKELKTIVLNETPWLLDAEKDEEKNKRLAILLDLNSLKESQELTLKKLIEQQNSNGSFSWFNGGKENIFITQHIVAGLGHLSKMFPENKEGFIEITNKTIPFLDQNFISKNKIDMKYVNNYLNLHYWYARSFYLKDFPLDENLKTIFDKQLINFKKEWLSYSLYQKGLAAIILQRMGEKDWAKKITTHLKETVSVNTDKGMYWLENESGYYWYQSPIETQAILIEAFDEIEKNTKYVEEMKAWLLFQKQTNHWSTTKSTSEAVYALLMQGKNWSFTKNDAKIKVGNSKISLNKLIENEKKNETGFTKINWIKEEISNDMGNISINNISEAPVFGGVYWQYLENYDKIKSDSTSVISISKKLYRKVKNSDKNNLVEISNNNITVGDLITIKLTIKTKENLEFIHLKDARASCFEPIDVISGYKYEDGATFYKSTRDTATHLFFDHLDKGTYVLEYDVRVTNSGSFTEGIATIQSMYAPEFSSHSITNKIKIE